MTRPVMTGQAAPGWYWVRHAPVRNPDGLIYGRLDFDADLTDGAALEAAAALLPRGALWVESPLRRARQTGAALRAIVDESAAAVVEPDFAEQHLGDWQGRVAREIYAAYPGDHPFWRRPAATAPPGGESFSAMAARVRAAILRIAAAPMLFDGASADRDGVGDGTGRPVIIVAHAGPIRVAMATARGLDDEAALALAVPPLSVTMLPVPAPPRPAPRNGLNAGPF